MGKKILLISIVWIILFIIIFILYLLRGVTPVKEFLDWVTSLWSVIAFLGAGALLASRWIIKHSAKEEDCKNIKQLSIFPKDRRGQMFIAIGVILMLVGFGLVIFQLNIHKEAKTNVDIQPINTPVISNNNPTSSFNFPTFINASDIKPDQPIEIWLGENGYCAGYKWSDFDSGASKPMGVASLGGIVPFNPHTFGGRLYVDISVYGGKDFTPITIKDNVATVVPPSWDENHDDYAYEVVNESGDPIFQLIYKTQFSIVIKGVFPVPGSLLIGDNLGFRYGNFERVSFEVLHLDSIFKYPSKDYPKVRVSQEVK